MNQITPSELRGLLPSTAALERLIYLVGPVRGGTTLMQRAMNLDPRALVLPKVTHFMQNVWRYRRSVHERLLRQIIRLGPSWDQQAIEQRLDKAQQAEFRRIVNAAFAARDLASLYKLLPIAYSLSPAFAKRAADMACWQDKNNDWRYLGAVARAFPQSRFVFLVRDPRSVALSGAGRLALKAGELTPRLSAPNIVSMSLYWRLMAQRFLDFAHRHPDRARIVRYEDFLLKPAATLHNLFLFTSGAAPSLADLEAGLSQIGGASTLDAGERYDGVSRTPMERWKTAMTPEQIDLIAQVTAPTASRFGYDVRRPDGLQGLVGTLRSVIKNGPAMTSAAKLIIEEGYELLLHAPGARLETGLSPHGSKSTAT